MVGSKSLFFYDAISPIVLTESLDLKKMFYASRYDKGDPDLPEELLPPGWLRSQAAALFQKYHDLLAENANLYFDSVYADY